MSTQSQSGGIGSHNVQINIEHRGLSVRDVQDIAQDVFNQNFDKLASQSAQIAEQRAKEIRDEILDALASNEKVNLDTFSNPDRQVALLDAQKAYVLSGDQELKSMLINLVTKLAEEDRRDLKAIVYEEAIKTAPSLTPELLDILAIIFIVRYVRFGNITNKLTLATQFDRYLFTRVSNFQVTAGDLRHLEYARCGKTTITTVPILQVLKSNYAGLFQKGLTPEELQSEIGDNIPASLIMPCLNNSQTCQLAALNVEILKTKMDGIDWTEEKRSSAIRLLDSNMLDEDAIWSVLESAHPTFSKLKAVWADTPIGQFELTSVGLAIAHSRLGNVDADLSIWL